MRARLLLPLLVLVAGSLGCQKASTPPPSSSGFDVYVPTAPDGGDDGGADASDAAEEGFGVGQVDRAGRPLVAVLLVPSNLQDSYNAQPTFTGSQPRSLAAAIEARLVELDTLVLDGGPDPTDWPVTSGATQLLPMFTSDTLLVDTARPCTSDAGAFVPSYLDLEREAFLSAPAHTTCGGRTPNENVVDETLALLVTGDREGGPAVTQGPTAATRPATTTFPYLAPPN